MIGALWNFTDFWWVLGVVRYVKICMLLSRVVFFCWWCKLICLLYMYF